MHRRRIRTVAVAAITAALVAPTAVWAADRFTDVPDTNEFHDDIAWLAEAGVTLGCNPPANDRFCPTGSVTREQMAAFMRRLAENQVVDAATVDGVAAQDLLPGGVAPEGTTMRGSYFVDINAQAANDRGVSAISFGYSLEGPPTAVLVRAGAAAPAECPGTAADPQAAPGYLCVYEVDHTNVGFLCVASSVPFYACDEAGPYGAGVYVEAVAAGIAYSVGTWAVTAPAEGILQALSADRVHAPANPNAPRND
jgi:hypothetical protein